MRHLQGLIATIVVGGIIQAEMNTATDSAKDMGTFQRRRSSRGRGRQWSGGTAAKHRAKRRARCR